MPLSVLLVDNNDSFTGNLLQLFKEDKSCTVTVMPSATVTEQAAGSFDKIVFSPGAGLPHDYPAMFQLLTAFGSRKSFLGVCLGHQAIAEFFGAALYNQAAVRHGVQQRVRIDTTNEPLYRGLPPEIMVGLYHSWAVRKETLPENIIVTAETDTGIVMSIKHTTFDIRGVQFHPESYMGQYGKEMIRNWLS